MADNATIVQDDQKTVFREKYLWYAFEIKFNYLIGLDEPKKKFKVFLYWFFDDYAQYWHFHKKEATWR